MQSQGRVIIIWLFWLIAGICGVAILLAFICYCRYLPRLHKSFDEKYFEPKKDYYYIQDTMHQDCTYTRIKQTEVHRYARPVSYGGQTHHYAQLKQSHKRDHAGPSSTSRCYIDNMDDLSRAHQAQQYASYGMLDDIDETINIDAIKTRSLPAFLRPRPKPLTTEEDLQHLYAEIGDSITKKYKRRMRNEHAAIIAMSKSQSQSMDANAVVVYDQRTAL